MFGLFNSEETRLREQAEEIIRSEFRDGLGRPYCVTPAFRSVLKDIAKQIKLQGGNAYDVAVAYMLAQVRSMVSPDASMKKWTEGIEKKCERLMVRGPLGQAVLEKYGLQKPNQSPSENNESFPYKTFEEWYEVYVYSADAAHQGIASLIDFIDHEPLNRAFEDKVDPITLGKIFGENFDIKNMP